MNETYSYESLTIFNGTGNTKDLLFEKDKELNPILNVSINFLESDKFALRDISSYKFIQNLTKYDFSKQFTESDIIIYYNCGKDPYCASSKEYIYNKEYPYIFAQINITYQGYKIDHLNELPVYEDDSGFYSKDLTIRDKNKYMFVNSTFEWEIIKYKDQKSLFDSVTKRKTEFTFGRIKQDLKENIKEYDSYADKAGLIQNFYYLPLFGFYFNNPNNNYLLYKRTKVSFLDVIANIGALFSTIKFFFALAFSFYSTNFNNYTIVSKLLNPPKKEIKSIELSHKNISENNISINDLDNDAPLIGEQSNKNQKNNNIESINDNDNNNGN